MADSQSAQHNPQSKPRPVIGLLGGIGAGKSLVASQFAKLGCKVVDADQVGHELLREPAVRRAILERFGPEVFGASGEVDRGRLAARVFANRQDLSALEAIVHPELWRRVRQAVEDARLTSAAAVVLDAALILEKGLDNLCTVMVYIDVPEEVRRKRAGEARGWDLSEVARREAPQISLKTKQGRADYIVDNSTSPEHTFEQVRTILSRIVR
jgi:dephospho-CoA kinase